MGDKARAREYIKGLIPNKVLEEDTRRLNSEISLGEINEAIQALGNGKAPGSDGLTTKFYKECKEWIGKDLLRVYQEAIAKGSLGKEINRGLIKLIPKKGDKTQIKNWRPITLLNVSYKIMGKVLAKRLEPILPKIISPTQTCFVKGRYILENILSCWEAMQWDKESNQKSSLLLLDFEKEYDRIEWSFVRIVMEGFGFPSHFCNMVKVLMNDANACGEVNDIKSDFFDLSRSIRQGCPLASILFVITTDALYYLMRDCRSSNKVQGLILPNGEDLSNIQFADDTTILTKLEHDNMDTLMAKLELFCKASDNKISLSKSTLLG